MAPLSVIQKFNLAIQLQKDGVLEVAEEQAENKQ
jgi:hypothetical protein